MRVLITLTVCLLTAAPAAWATDTELKPSELFATDSQSIVLIKTFDKAGQAIMQGSGVVIVKDTVVSNCHVIENAVTTRIFYQHKQITAKLLYEDEERDLCSFTVKNLSAPPVHMGSTSLVKVGDTAYAIGAPEGLELTLSGSLISSLRNVPGGVVLQMTTPISPGSSGGGLFDSQGRLIGITSYYMKQGEQLNFALPVEWVNQLPQRGKLARANTEHIARTTNTTQKSNLQKGIRAVQAGDYTAAFEIFEPLAKEGDAFAQSELGFMYWLGLGVPQNYAQAAVWLHKAAQQGVVEAQFSLGLLYATGQGVPRNYGKALVWYRKAAKQGNAAAEYYLGALYAFGDGVPQDYMQALAWYRKAATQGNAHAQFDLGVMYDNGNGVPKDYAQAATWYGKAATQGVSEAQYNLGKLYEDGEGVPQDYMQAVALFRKAADQGNANAQSELGVMYMNGQGVPVNYAQAVRWFQKAAAQGYSLAQSNLGVMYQFGQGVPQNYVVAYALYNLSASLDSTNHNLATTNRSKLLDSMTPAQIETGQELTREMERVGVLKALGAYLNSGEP